MPAKLSTVRRPRAASAPAPRVKAGATVFLVGTLIDPIPESRDPPRAVLVKLPGPLTVNAAGELLVPFGGIALP